MIIKVKEKEYKLKFGYKALGKSGILKEVTAIQSTIREKWGNGENEAGLAEMIGDIFELISRMVLAAMQKFNQDYRVDYDSHESVQNGIDKVYDLLDDYMEEEDALDIMSFFEQLTEELFDNGFLSKKSQALEENMLVQDATITPMDHKKKEN